MDHDKALREQLVYLLKGGGAHLDFERAIADLPAEMRGKKPEGIPYSPWALLEHLRICQWDILEYTRDPDHVSPDFPVGYWPKEDTAPSDEAWNESVASFRSDSLAMQDIVTDPAVNLTAQLPHGKTGHTVLREALLIVDHNAYHLGQLVAVRRALGAWPEG
ncbi:MAG: DinB family protein [Pirellulales bacterium]|nr:DinB family protein [Pirellulales bacterium]